MKPVRQCSRPGCSHPAVATLTFVYAESIAVVGPMATSNEPHSWDLCADHARRITVPRGWEMMRSSTPLATAVGDDDDLTALAEAVRERGGRGGVRSAADAGFVTGSPAPTSPPSPVSPSRSSAVRPATTPRPGRRGHLRVLPDPVD